MLFQGQDDDALYEALLKRDARLEGSAYVCVSSTGVFCRLTCPARKPKRENCTFYRTPRDCLEAGFRPCRRCRPLAPLGSEDPTVRTLLAELERDPGRRWTENLIASCGHDPSTVRRAFKRQFGITFLELARTRRLREGFAALAGGEKVIAAQHEAGFDSSSAFRAAFARLLGCAPGDLKPGRRLCASWIATPLGDMVAVATATHLHLLEFVDRRALPSELRRLQMSLGQSIGLGTPEPILQAEAELAAYFAGRSARFQTPLHPSGSAFARHVWDALRQIPPGETRSYSEIARAIGRPEAIRAVARANGANQIALMIPCHRVIGADGALTGYGGGLWRKQRLIDIERRLRATVGVENREIEP